MDTATEAKQTIRVRIQHSHTLKDGWRLSETTVEATGTILDWDAIDNELRNVYNFGQMETNYRNGAEDAS